MNAPAQPNYLMAAVARLQGEIDEALAFVPERPSPDQMLTTQQVAALLSVSVRTLEAWRSNGAGPTTTKLASSVVRYKYEDLLKWVAGQNRENAE